MAIKAQTLTHFITKFTYDFAPNPEMEALDEQNQDDDLAQWKLFVDGSSNQHGCNAELVFQTLLEEQIEHAIRMGFKTINNEAEYEILLVNLRVATTLKVESLDIYSDS